MKVDDQKTWETPTLTIYGDAAELTLVKSKRNGATDGFTFNGNSISG